MRLALRAGRELVGVRKLHAHALQLACLLPQVVGLGLHGAQLAGGGRERRRGLRQLGGEPLHLRLRGLQLGEPGG